MIRGHPERNAPVQVEGSFNMEAHVAAGGRRRTILLVLAITVLYLLVEVVVGLLTNSLALIADAVHMFTDAGALALAAFAAWMAEKPATPEKTYGYYRIEILAALANALILTASSLYILYEAYQRFLQPAEVVGLPMLIVAVIGLLVNLVGIRLLHASSEENLNMKGAFYEVVKDALGSVGVIVAGVVILLTGFSLIDPIVSLLIALLILPRTWQLFNEAVDILLESTPAGISLGAVKQALLDIEGVDSVHDLHVWTITSGFVALSGHVVLGAQVDRQRAQAILVAVNDRLKDKFDIEHTTIQTEFSDLKEEGVYP
jgi:cobalt-zinc-cadmium efflux system protein